MKPCIRRQGGERRSSRQNGGLKDGFAKDTAAKSGKPLRTVERDITCSRKLGPDLDRGRRDVAG